MGVTVVVVVVGLVVAAAAATTAVVVVVIVVVIVGLVELEAVAVVAVSVVAAKIIIIILTQSLPCPFQLLDFQSRHPPESGTTEASDYTNLILDIENNINWLKTEGPGLRKFLENVQQDEWGKWQPLHPSTSDIN